MTQKQKTMRIWDKSKIPTEATKPKLLWLEFSQSNKAKAQWLEFSHWVSVSGKDISKHTWEDIDLVMCYRKNCKGGNERRGRLSSEHWREKRGEKFLYEGSTDRTQHWTDRCTRQRGHKCNLKSLRQRKVFKIK